MCSLCSWPAPCETVNYRTPLSPVRVSSHSGVTGSEKNPHWPGENVPSDFRTDRMKFMLVTLNYLFTATGNYRLVIIMFRIVQVK